MPSKAIPLRSGPKARKLVSGGAQPQTMKPYSQGLLGDQGGGTILKSGMSQPQWGTAPRPPWTVSGIGIVTVAAKADLWGFKPCFGF